MLKVAGGGLQSNSEQKIPQILDDALIEPVQFGALVTGQFVIAGKGLEKTGGEWGVDTFEQLQEDTGMRSSRERPMRGCTPRPW